MRGAALQRLPMRSKCLCINLQKIEPHWDDILHLTNSLKRGRVSSTGIMRTFLVGECPTRLAQAAAGPCYRLNQGNISYLLIVIAPALIAKSKISCMLASPHVFSANQE